MLNIVWNVFAQDNTSEIYCADYDGNGWMEAFVEVMNENDEDYRAIWIVDHEGKATTITEGDYLRLAGIIELEDKSLQVVNGRHGLDAVYYIDNGSFGQVEMPDDEWWYSVYEVDGMLWGTRVEYSDEKEYIDHELLYDNSTHKLILLDG